MQLAKEYCNRHKIEVPIVKIEEQGCVLYKSQDPSHKGWVLMQISQQLDGHNDRPGKFTLRHQLPQLPSSDGGKSEKYGNVVSWVQIPGNFVVDWDEYEDYFINWAKNKKIASNIHEVVLALWENFVIMNEISFKKYAQDDNFTNILNGDKNSPEVRYDYFKKFINIFAKENSNGFDKWSREMFQLVRRYSFWVSELNGNK